MSTLLMIGPAEIAMLTELRERASARPVDMQVMTEAIKHRAGKAAHMIQMTAQTVHIPTNFMVTYSIETGHPIGTCAHMSMSVGKEGRVPNQHAVWMVAEALGFVGGLESCTCWLEELQVHGQAVNVVQPLAH